jgi:hypothetical protein
MSIIFLCCNNVRICDILKKSCIENVSLFFFWGGRCTPIFSSFVVVVVVIKEEEEEEERKKENLSCISHLEELVAVIRLTVFSSSIFGSAFVGVIVVAVERTKKKTSSCINVACNQRIGLHPICNLE